MDGRHGHAGRGIDTACGNAIAAGSLAALDPPLGHRRVTASMLAGAGSSARWRGFDGCSLEARTYARYVALPRPPQCAACCLRHVAGGTGEHGPVPRCVGLLRRCIIVASSGLASPQRRACIRRTHRHVGLCGAAVAGANGRSGCAAPRGDTAARAAAAAALHQYVATREALVGHALKVPGVPCEYRSATAVALRTVAAENSTSRYCCL